MAALQPALAMLGRRSCGSSGRSAAASMGGRGLEIQQVFRPAAVRNLEGWRRFTTGGTEPTQVGGDLRMWWQRARDRCKNANLEEKDRALFVHAVFVLGTPAVIAMKSTRDLLHDSGLLQSEAMFIYAVLLQVVYDIPAIRGHLDP